MRAAERRNAAILIGGSVLLTAAIALVTIFAAPQSGFQLIIFGAMGIGAYILFIWWTARRFDRIIDVHRLPNESLCPACAYSLRDSPIESDGCKVCPECGAAWKAPVA